LTARRLLEAAGVGMVFVLPYVWVQLSPGYKDLYHRLLPVTSVSGGLLLDLLAISGLSLAAFAAIDRARPRNRAIAWVMVCVVLSWMLARDAILLLEIFGVPLRLSYLSFTLWAPLVVLALGSVLLLDGKRPRRSEYSRVIQAVRWGLAVAGCAVTVIFPRLLYLASRSQPVETAGFQRRERIGSADSQRSSEKQKPAEKQRSAEQQRPAEQQRRIVWILLDELSYDQTFGHR
jgi:hypothetical protein